MPDPSTTTTDLSGILAPTGTYREPFYGRDAREHWIEYRYMTAGDREAIQEASMRLIMDEGGDAKPSLSFAKGSRTTIARLFVAWDLPVPCTEAFLETCDPYVVDQLMEAVRADNAPDPTTAPSGAKSSSPKRPS